MWSYPFLWKSTHVTFCKVSPVCFISPRFLDHVPVELLFSISGDLQVGEKWRKIFFLGVVGYKITPKRWKPSQENNTEGGNIGAQCSTDNLSSTISEFGQCYITGHWVGFKEVKNATLWLHILHWHFVAIFFFSSKNWVFIIFISFVSNFCNRILTNQLVIRNCQWNCMSNRKRFDKSKPTWQTAPLI